MAHYTKNSVESISVRVPPSRLSPSSSQSSSSSSSSPPNSTTERCRANLSDCRLQSFVSQNGNNFKRSALPARIMNYRNGSWVNFPTEVLDAVKSSFLERKPIVDIVIEGSRYFLDFLRMLQIHFETGNQRSIAWIDENGNCYFPKTFLSEGNDDCLENSENNTTRFEIEIHVNGNLGKRQRAVSDKDDEVNSEKPSKDSKRQHLVANRVGCPRWTNTRLVRESERAYTLIRGLFLSSIGQFDTGATITSIHHCTRLGNLSRARFEVFQKQIDFTKASRGKSNIVYAWLGAPAKVAESILAHGFGIPSKISTYGVGIYLSALGLPNLSASLAEADENGERSMILCRVILGNVEKVEAGSQQCYPSSLDFDSGSDDPKSPKWYIVWSSNMNTHILPECVVSYKSSGEAQAQLRGQACVKYPLEKLFLRMKSLLSPSKLQDVMNLYHTFKAGKLAKDNFFKQLRMIAGDDTLLSTIQEIRTSA